MRIYLSTGFYQQINPSRTWFKVRYRRGWWSAHGAVVELLHSSSRHKRAQDGGSPSPDYA
jgi:hypothetical protein